MLADKECIHLAIVDDHPMIIEGLEKIIKNAFSRVDINCFTTGKDFLNFLQVEKAGCDMILLDINLPDINGFDLCKKIKMYNPNTVVLAFSNHCERGSIMQMLNYGASGYILKSADAGEIVRCIENAVRGDVALSKEIKEIIGKPSLLDFRPVPVLTKREKEILQFIADGKTSNIISEILHLSPLTVETHRRNLMQKLEVKNVAAMVKVATQFKLI